MPADLIIYAIVAAGLVFWLRGTLGTRQEGDEKNNFLKNLPDLDGTVTQDKEIATLGLKNMNAAEDQMDLIKNDKTGVIGIDNPEAEKNLSAIINADKGFDLKFFLNAAQDVFVMVVEAFADGDREALEDLLATPVYQAFKTAIEDREARGETVTAEIQAIHQARIIEAKLDKKMAYITLRFVADEITVTRDENKNTISGHEEKTKRMTDIWTFGRDLKSRDPRWFVYETRGDFDGDNDFVPNSDLTNEI